MADTTVLATASSGTNGPSAAVIDEPRLIMPMLSAKSVIRPSTEPTTTFSKPSWMRCVTSFSTVSAVSAIDDLLDTLMGG